MKLMFRALAVQSANLAFEKYWRSTLRKPLTLSPLGVIKI